MKKQVAVAALAAVLGLAAGAAQAGVVTVSLGPSSEDFTLHGQGAVAPGVGSFTIQQGAESFNAGTNTTTDILSGTITGSSIPGLSSGHYAFVTTYKGAPIGSGGMQVEGQSNPSNLNEFFYTAFDPSLDMTLKLTGTPDGNFNIPLVTNGVFDALGFGFGFVSANCSNVAVCGQNNVGLTPGASIFGPVTIGATFNFSAVPEPAEWALMLVGLGALGAALRMRQRTVAA
jgi:hypothetical protein